MSHWFNRRTLATPLVMPPQERPFKAGFATVGGLSPALGPTYGVLV